MEKQVPYIQTKKDWQVSEIENDTLKSHIVMLIGQLP